MKIKDVIEYDSVRDSVIGPHNYLQVLIFIKGNNFEQSNF